MRSTHALFATVVASLSASMAHAHVALGQDGALQTPPPGMPSPGPSPGLPSPQPGYSHLSGPRPGTARHPPGTNPATPPAPSCTYPGRITRAPARAPRNAPGRTRAQDAARAP